MPTNYDHIPFTKNWEITNKSHFLLGQCVAYIEAINNMPVMPERAKELMLVSLIKGAQATTAIEGNTLSTNEINDLLEGKHMPPSKQYQEIEVKNIIDAYNLILKEVVDQQTGKLVDSQMVLRFHRLVGKDLGEHFEAMPGEYRQGNVIVGNYRPVDSSDVPYLMKQYCDWMQEQFGYESGRQTLQDAIVQAIVAHVYLELIHPFGDGNGRTGRLLEFYILLRSGCPDIVSHILSNHYNETRSEYYRQLQMVSVRRDLAGFIEYALLGFRDGILNIFNQLQEDQIAITWKKLVYDKFNSLAYKQRAVFKRQRTLALELRPAILFTLDEVSTLTLVLAKEYANVSTRTIRRDVNVLVDLGLLLNDNGKYQLNLGQLFRLMPRRKINS